MLVTFSSAPIYNVSFFIAAILCLYFYYVSTYSDPGFVPRPQGRNEQMAIVRGLVEAKTFDEARYCIHCNIHKPLRSKHCKHCERCVAKFDQYVRIRASLKRLCSPGYSHCPFLVVCVGSNNHRSFMLYLFTMVFGVSFFLNLIWRCEQAGACS